MTTIFGQSFDQTNGGGKSSIVDDFMYGSNVATSHVYVRMGFLRKVYGILSAQLLITTIIATSFLLFEPLETFIKAKFQILGMKELTGNIAIKHLLFLCRSQWLVVVSAVASIGLIFALQMMSNVVPHNYLLLAAFTLCESLLIGVVVIQYEVASVIEAFALTCTVTVGLTLYTFQTKRDFSSWGAGLFAALCVLVLTFWLQMILPSSEMLHRGLGAAGAVLFSLYIIYDTQMIMTRVSPEEYIHATTILYLDIINLFLHILRAIGKRDG